MRWKRMDGQVYRRHKEAIHHPSLFHFMFCVFPLFFTSNSFIGSPSPPLCSTCCLFFSLFFLHPFLSLGVGRCTSTRRQSIHQPTLFQTRPATVWETRSSTFFLLHALKAPSSDRRRPGLPRWATLGSFLKKVMRPKSSRNQNISQDIYVDLYMSSFCRTNFKIVLQFIKW